MKCNGQPAHRKPVIHIGIWKTEVDCKNISSCLTCSSEADNLSLTPSSQSIALWQEWDVGWRSGTVDNII